MGKRVTGLGLAAAAFALLLTATPARAQTINKLMFLTFSGPVQLPGVTLPAGKYDFQLADPGTSRTIMQVFTHERGRAIGLFMTLPATRQRVTEDPVVTFRETPAGVPPEIRALFYPGERDGYEFFYPKVHARATAATVAPIAQAPTDVVRVEMQRAPVIELAPSAAIELEPVSLPELPNNALPLTEQ